MEPLGAVLGTHYRNITDADIEDAPTEEWVCPSCKTTNTEWVISLKWVSGKSDQKYLHGDCQRCFDMRTQQEAERHRAIEDAERIHRSKVLLEKSLLPNKHRQVTFEQIQVNEQNRKVVETFKRIEHADRWIYLWGLNSVGKSWLMSAAINRLASLGKPALYINESVFFDKIREQWDTGGSEFKLLTLFEQAEFIFWDEFLIRDLLGAGASPWRYDRILSIIDMCSEEDKIIVFGSNITPEIYNSVPMGALEDRAGKRIVARLKRMQLYPMHLDTEPFF